MTLLSSTAILFRRTLRVWTQELSIDYPARERGSLPFLPCATVDELPVHAFAAVLPPDGHPGSDIMNDPSTITPSPSKISAPQTRQKQAPGPSCDEQLSARPSPDSATTTATIARGPPRHTSCSNDKALGINQSFVRVYQFRCPRLASNELFGEDTSVSDYSIPIPPHNPHRHGTSLAIKEKIRIVWHACVSPAPRFLVRHTLRGKAAGVIHE